MQRSGEMPGMSSREYPNAFRYFLSSHKSRAVSALLRSAFTMTGYVELGPRNAYLSPLGRDLSSTFGAFCSLHESSICAAGTVEFLEVVVPAGLSHSLFSPRF